MATTPMYDKQFGDAVRTLRAMQILNPDASNNTDPVTGSRWPRRHGGDGPLRHPVPHAAVGRQRLHDRRVGAAGGLNNMGR